MTHSRRQGLSGERRCVFLILDGLGDRPNEALGGLTPLEAAHTPRLDRLAGSGLYGLVDPIQAGVIPNTHTGVGMMLGLYPEQAAMLSRGPVEAFGAGRQLRRGEVAFRANLATLERRDGRYFVTDRRAGRISGDSRELARALDRIDLGDDVSASFVATDQHRGALVFSGPGLGAQVSDTDPGDGHIPDWLPHCKPLQADSARTADKVNRFVTECFERLSRHPLNRERIEAGKLPATGVITRGAGVWRELDHLLQDQGVASVLVAGCNTVTGLGRMFGMKTVKQPGFTADVDTDIRGKLQAAVEALRRVPLVYVHIKAPDLFSHDFQPDGKRGFLERVDDALEVVEESGAMLALTADHTTDSNTGAHTEHPVPALIHDPLAAPGGGQSVHFGETACRNGNLPRLSGHEFLQRVLALLQSPS